MKNYFEVSSALRSDTLEVKWWKSNGGTMPYFLMIEYQRFFKSFPIERIL